MRSLLIRRARALLRRGRRLVLEGRLPRHNAPLRWLALAFRVVALAVMRFERDSGRERAAALAYSSLLALIPLALLGVSALEFVLAPGRLKPVEAGPLAGAEARIETGSDTSEGDWLRVRVENAADGLALSLWLLPEGAAASDVGTLASAAEAAATSSPYELAFRASELPLGAVAIDELAGCAAELRTPDGRVAAAGNVPGTRAGGEATEWVLNLVFPQGADDVKHGFLSYFDESRRMLEGSDSGTSIRILSVVLLVYFATSLMTSADRTVAVIWGTVSVRRLLPRLSSYWAAITLGPLLLAASFAGTALAGDILGEDAGTFLRKLLPYGVTWASVFLFYRLMPHTRVKTSAALVGAVVAGSLWEGSKQLMGWYLVRPKTLLTAMTIFPAALLWMYVSWLIAILGLEVAYVVHHGAWKPGRQAGRATLRGAQQDALVLAVAVEIAADFDRGRYPDRAELARRVGVGEDDASRAIDLLSAAGLVEPHDDGGLRPTRGTNGISALEVVRASRGTLAKRLRRTLPPGALAARLYVSRVERLAAEDLGDVSLGDLARDAARAPPPA